MSEQNAKTLEVYEQAAKTYLENNVKHDNLDPAKAQLKRARLADFIKQSFAPLPEHARIFEIGSADGDNAKYLESLGYDVTASDVATDFLATLEARDLYPVKFNVLTDEFPGKYHGIFCWRVFVHFTPDDVLTALQKTYAALEPGGRFVVNLINREVKDVDQEWVDFPGVYEMGVERYFNYFREADVRAMIAQTDYRIVDQHLDGISQDNKWLVFVLEK